MSELTKLTLTGAIEGLDKGDFSAVELTQAFVDTIEASNASLNAYVVETPELALSMAKAEALHVQHRHMSPTEDWQPAEPTALWLRSCQAGIGLGYRFPTVAGAALA